mgnify:CR=1 FL=1
MLFLLPDTPGWSEPPYRFVQPEDPVATLRRATVDPALVARGADCAYANLKLLTRATTAVYDARKLKISETNAAGETTTRELARMNDALEQRVAQAGVSDRVKVQKISMS